jgi:GT2 family glycosyltransferase
MDADDWMHRQRLALQIDALEKDPALAGVGCRVRIFPRTAMSDGRRRYEAWLNAVETPEDVRREAFVECPVAHPGLLLRRSVLLRFGWRDAGWPEDYDLVLRLLAAGERLAVVPRRLLGWRDGPERLSRRDPAYGLDRFTACKAAFLAEGLLAGRGDYVLWGYGDTGRTLRRALLAHGKQPSHIVELHPGRLGQRIHGVPVIAPDALAPLHGSPVVASVAGLEARTRIRDALARLGRREGRDFVVAA